MYRYYIGRENRSVNEQIRIRRIDQQLKLNYLKENDKKTYCWMKWSILGRSTNLPEKGGRKISEMAYGLAQKFVGFNMGILSLDLSKSIQMNITDAKERDNEKIKKYCFAKN